MTKVSVLIPTYNASKYIETLLIRLNQQVLEGDEKLEIIIVDSSSTDNTINIVQQKYPDVIVKVIPNGKFDHGGTRNYMASIANGNYLLFMTQDAIPYDEFMIGNLLKSLVATEVYVSYARQIPQPDSNPLEVFARNFNYPNKSQIKDKCSIGKLGIKTFFNSNVCSMYKKEMFNLLGGFPEKIILNEDMIFASKVILNGYKVCYCAEAKVYHSHNYTLKQQFKRYFDIGMAFNETKYLLQYASNEKEGIRMVMHQFNYLIENKANRLILRALLEIISKYLGYNLGKRHKYLPLKFKKILSAYMK